jgi:GPI mannosyltransferase 4
MLLLRWIWIGNGNDGEIAPIAVFWTLRVLMFVISFVLEDWAIHELISSPRHRRVAVLLVASSYVTWTYQTHTFSNSVETLIVAWSLVLIQRIVETPVSRPTTHIKFYLMLFVWRDSNYTVQQRPALLSSSLLGAVAMFGIFNRITFPAFLLIPGFRLIPYFLKK